MRNVKRIVISLLSLLLILAILAFVLENRQSAKLLFLGWSGPEMPVSILIVAALLIGMLIGPLLGWALNRPRKAARKQLS